MHVTMARGNYHVSLQHLESYSKQRFPWGTLDLAASTYGTKVASGDMRSGEATSRPNKRT